MSAPIVDAENEILSNQSYPSIIERIKNRSKSGDPIPVVIEHRRSESLPVGFVEDAFEKDGKLGFTAVIASGGPGSLPDTVQQLISQNVLRHVSIGGDINQSNDRAVEMVYDPAVKKHVRRINDAVIRELSLTGLPVNEEATFTLAKSVNLDAKKVKALMKRFEKALSKELITQKISKAISDSDLGAIEDALKNLADVLKDQFNVDIDVDAFTGTEDNVKTDQPEMEMEETDTESADTESAELDEVEEDTESDDTDEVVEEEIDVEEDTENADESMDDTVTDEDMEDTEEVDVEEIELDEDEEDTEKAITPVTEEGVETKLDTLIGLLKELKGDEMVNKSDENLEIEKSEDTENNFEKEGGEKEMEKRLICKSCGEDFSYGSDESIEKSFKFCPVCSNALSKAFVDNDLNKVYFIESVADAKKVNDETSKNAVIRPEGHPVEEANLSGEEGDVEVAGKEAAKNAVIHPEGHPVVESKSGPENLIVKSENEVSVEKATNDMVIRDKKQGNQLEDFPKAPPVDYQTQNKEDVYAAKESTNKEDVFKRGEYNTTYNTDAGTVDKQIQKSLEPIQEALMTIQKSLSNPSEGRRALFVNPNKVEKSQYSKEDLDNKAILNAMFSK